jgi:hypothetical protein
MKSTAKSITALIICFFSLQTVFAATGDITGQIIEKETQAPVAFAQVTLDNGTTKTVIAANEYGYYSANHLPIGKYQVWVKYDNQVVAMNPIHIKDSYTLGVNLIVSTIVPTVNTKEVKKENTTGALKQHIDNTFNQIVKPTQGQVKSPLVYQNPYLELLLGANPITIATKNLMA